MASKDNSINFRNISFEYFSKINIDDLMSSDKNLKEKEKIKLNSIFSMFDTNNDDCLDKSEFDNIIRKFDSFKNKKISEEEIKDFSKSNKINKKVAKNFLQMLQNKLPKEETALYNNGLIGKHYTNTHLVDYIVKEGNYRAVYDCKEDTIYPKNGKNLVKIVGVLDYNDSPKIVITDKNGQDTEIPLNMKNSYAGIPYLGDAGRMRIATNIISSIGSYPDTVLDDFRNNAKCIKITDLDLFMSGYADVEPDNEGIALTITDGIEHCREVLAHEIGHLVDYTHDGFISESIPALKEALKRDCSLLAYARKNVKELYAEYYVYANRIERSFNGASDTYIRNYLNEQERKLLSGIREKSIDINKRYKEELENRSQRIAELNKQEGAITTEAFEKYDVDTLWDGYNTFVRSDIENILEKNYKDLYNKYKRTPDEFLDNDFAYKLSFIKDLRNDFEIKPLVEKMFNEMEAKIEADKKAQAELDTWNNLPVKKGLKQMKFAHNRKKPIKKDQLKAKLDNLSKEEKAALYTNEELKKLIASICSYEYNTIPDSVKNAFKDGFSTPITDDVIIAFRNEQAFGNFLAKSFWAKKK